MRRRKAAAEAASLFFKIVAKSVQADFVAPDKVFGHDMKKRCASHVHFSGSAARASTAANGALQAIIGSDQDCARAVIRLGTFQTPSRSEAWL